MTEFIEQSNTDYFKIQCDLPIQHRDMDYFSDDELDEYYANLIHDDEPQELEFNHG